MTALPRQGVHDVDRPAHVQALSQPTRARRPRVDAEPLRFVPRPEGLDGIGGRRSGRRHLGQELPVRTPEVELIARQAPRRFRGNVRPVLWGAPLK